MKDSCHEDRVPATVEADSGDNGYDYHDGDDDHDGDGDNNDGNDDDSVMRAASQPLLKLIAVMVLRDER
jgi:hypothetical protein